MSARRNGFAPRPVVDRFWEKVQKGDGCWVWSGGLISGYGRFVVRHGLYVRAYRFSYELANGPIPDGLFVCHRCDNPPCVNPAHLFLGTCKDNFEDMRAKGRGRNPIMEANAAKTACPRGHQYTPENTVRPRKGGKWCLECKRRWARDYQRRLRAKNKQASALTGISA
jgi:hypothetical protein